MIEVGVRREEVVHRQRRWTPKRKNPQIAGLSVVTFAEVDAV